jgi:hypothetical protein
MTTVLSIIGFAVLFALFGALRPRRQCSGGCSGCSNSCGRSEDGHDA